MFGYYHISATVLIEALTNPQNRHETREKYQCDDIALYIHPEWLIEHFVEKNGMDSLLRKELWK